MTNQFRLLFLALLVMLGFAVSAQAATITVCNANCTYNNTQLQTAINAAVAGDVIKLQEGFTYVGDFTLPVKAGAGSSAWVEIRSGVNATGVEQADNRYTATDIRMCPSGFVQDWYDCATRSPQDMTRIAKLQVSSNNAYGVRTVATASGTPVSYYRFKWLEFTANTYGGNALIGLLNDTASYDSGGSAHLPHHFEFDRVVIRGQPTSGQFRGMQIDANSVTLKNSHVYDIKAIGEGQALWANSSTGPIDIINNYVSGGAEVWLTGGGGTRPEPKYTIQASPTPTTTTFTLDRVTDLYVGKNIVLRQQPISVTSSSIATSTTIVTATPHGYTNGWQVLPQGITGCATTNIYNINQVPRRVSVISTTSFSIPLNCTTTGSGGTVGIRAQAEITAIVGNQVTVTPALPFAPAGDDLAISSLVISGMTFRYNVFTHPASWLTDYVLPKPTGIAVATETTGGTIAAGTYAYRVAAYTPTAQGQSSGSGAATEVSIVVPAGTSTNRNTITWTAVAGATSYRVHGRTPGGQTTYWTVTAPTTTYVDTGATGSGGSPSSTGAHWQVKNVFEFKQGINITAEYNLIENSWQDGQSGPCVLFTGTQQVVAADSAVIRGVTMRYNVIRNCMQFMQMQGTDALSHESARSGDFDINNNLFYNAGGIYGKGLKAHAIYIGGAGGGPRQTPNRAPFDVTFNHNTFHFFPTTAPNTAMMVDFCHNWPVTTPSPESLAPNTLITNNIFYNGSYGLSSIGVSASACGNGTAQGRIGLPPLGAGSLVSTNVLAGGTCSLFTSTATAMSCPTVATLESATFTNTTSIGGFAVKGTSPYFNAGLDGAPLGADIAEIEEGQLITQSGDNTGGVIVLPPVVSTLTLADGQAGTAYTVTLSGECNTVSCTWSTTGTLPLGLTFTSVNSTTATLIGTPTVGQTVNFTVVLTDTGAQTGSQAFTITIADAPVTLVRKRPSANNYSEFGHFVRATCPTPELDPSLELKVGDQCFNTTNFKLYSLNAVTTTTADWSLVDTTITLPTPTFSSVSGLFFTYASNVAWSMVVSPGNELHATSSHRYYTDLTNMTECRVWMRLATALTGASFIWLEYSTDTGTTFQTLGTATQSPQGDLTTIVNNYVVSPWQAIVAGAKADVVLRLFGIAATAQTATIRNTGFTCR
jgi:hypothetical protein